MGAVGSFLICLAASLANSSYESIIDDYFELRPPFKIGEKRKEFPDAISAAILRNWCDQTDTKLCVVTGDSDWVPLCTDKLTYSQSLVDFFALFPDQDLAKSLVLALTDPNAAKLLDEIADNFLSLCFYTSGVDGEVDVSGVGVEVKRAVIIEAEDGDAVAETDDLRSEVHPRDARLLRC